MATTVTTTPMKPDNARYDCLARNPLPVNIAFFSVAKARRPGKGEQFSSSPNGFTPGWFVQASCHTFVAQALMPAASPLMGTLLARLHVTPAECRDEARHRREERPRHIGRWGVRKQRSESR